MDKVITKMEKKLITVAAGVILNENNQILLVRKKGTQYFMHVGGKLEINESPEHALIREIREEIGCEIDIQSFIGKYETLAANEKNHCLVSYLYHAKIKSQPRLQAELEEITWLDLQETDIKLAPLTRDISIPWCKKYLNI